MSIEKQSSIIKYLKKKEIPKEEELLKKIQLNQKLQKHQENKKQKKEQPKEKKSQEQSISSNLSAKTQKVFTNIEFYTNKRVSEPYGDTIDKIHKNWWGNYELLQKHHGYIQWLFPNSFQSRFNQKATPLSPQEAISFRNNEEIAERYRQSYVMMLQFYGMKMKNKYTGQLTRTRKPNFQQRFKSTLLTNFHNHMRITRMLSSLTMIGLGRYAKELCKFLKHEIFSEEGKLKYLRTFKIYERQWKQFEDYKQSEDDLNIILREKKK